MQWIIILMNKPKLLIIDDLKDVRTTLRFILCELYEIFEADSGREAVQILKDNSINLVILDFNMPEMDGLEVLAEIKKLNRNIEVCMFSGESHPDIFNKARELGAFDYLDKSTPPHKLKLVLGNMQRVVELQKEVAVLRKYLARIKRIAKVPLRYFIG